MQEIVHSILAYDHFVGVIPQQQLNKTEGRIQIIKWYQGSYTLCTIFQQDTSTHTNHAQFWNEQIDCI